MRPVGKDYDGEVRKVCYFQCDAFQDLTEQNALWLFCTLEQAIVAGLPLAICGTVIRPSTFSLWVDTSQETVSRLSIRTCYCAFVIVIVEAALGSRHAREGFHLFRLFDILAGLVRPGEAPYLGMQLVVGGQDTSGVFVGPPKSSGSSTPPLHKYLTSMCTYSQRHHQHSRRVKYSTRLWREIILHCRANTGNAEPTTKTSNQGANTGAIGRRNLSPREATSY